MDGNNASDPQPCPGEIGNGDSATSPVVMHRLAEVRRAKGMSRRVLAQRLGITVEELRVKEASADVPISTLCRWAAALEVPITDLVVEPDESATMTRLPRLLAARLMKVAAKLRDRSRRRGIQRLAQTFVEQLTEILPDLEQFAQKNHGRLQNPHRQPPPAAPRPLSEQVFLKRREPEED